MDWAATGKTHLFLLLDLRYPNCKPDGFPTPNSHGLVGNVVWGESLAVVACDFPSHDKGIKSNKMKETYITNS